MGNNSGTLKSTKRTTKHIRRVLGEVPAKEPDVETLGLPFVVCRKIFEQLPLADIANCMLVCKEWRSLIDSCVFWLAYMQTHYDFGVKEPERDAPLHQWKYGVCLKLTGQNGLSHYAPSYVFNPFPDIWRCNIVTPYTTAPPLGSIDTYHSFLKSLEFLRKVSEQLRHFRVQSTIATCLLPWKHERMPTSYEILAMLGAHKEVVRNTQDAKPFSEQEMRNFYSIINTGYSGGKIEKDLYMWIANKAPDRCLVFDCNRDVVEPTPAFIISRLSSDWIGGVIYPL